MNLLRPSKTFTRIIRKMGYMVENRDKYWLDRIGTREVVGYGMNGLPMYGDRNDFPFPPIRWREVTPEIQSLNEKQKGDWRLLTIEEKKSLYRANFCQTFAEFQKPRGDWAEPIAHTLLLCCAGIWLFIYIRLFVYEELPETFTPSRQRAQMRRQIDLRINPVQGLASEWDYEKMDWKVVTWRTPPNPFIKCQDDE